MVTNDIVDAGEHSSIGRPRPFPTILLGGLVVGILDLLFAFTFYGLFLGAPPLRIFQSVAAGVIGSTAARAGGVKTFLLGILLHFVVATCIAAVYFLVARLFPILIRYAVVSGLLYGMVAYFGMKYMVLPLSAIGQRGTIPRLPIFLIELIGHALLVGLPLGLLMRRSTKQHSAEPL